MSSYVQIFVGPPEAETGVVVADVEAATGLTLMPMDDPAEGFEGKDADRMVRMFTEGNIYEDVPGLPFAEHPIQLTFYTAEKTIESERRFLDETFRRLRDTGRYTLFATLDVEVRIDPE